MYDVPERNLEPPDEPLPEYLECIVCEDEYSEEDMLQVHSKAICTWCAADIAKERFGSRLTKRAADLLVCPQCWRELHNGYCPHCKAAFEIASR